MSANPTLEEQFILRLPPELAERVRSMIRSGSSDLNLEFIMNGDA
jgi:TATA-binding protein-associated factor Taf7